MKRILEFESLRGLLAIWVVVAHLFPSIGLDPSKLGALSVIGEGNFPVGVFIIMSGFFIFYLLDSSQETYKIFTVRRFLRLYPAYLVCLILSILLLPTSLDSLHNLSWNDTWSNTYNSNVIKIFEDSLAYFFPQLFAHLTLLHGAIPSSILPNSSYAFIGPAWSISLEWQFYLVAPLVFGLLTKQKSNKMLLLITAVTIVLYFLLRGDKPLLFTQIPFFFLGIASFFVWRERDYLFEKKYAYRFLLPVSLIFATLLFKSIPVIIWFLVLFSVLSVEMTGGEVYEKLLCKVLNHPLLLQLGRISYSIYLSHVIVMYSMMRLLEVFGMTNQWMYGISLIVLTFCFTLIFSQFLYSYVEGPCIKFGKQLYSHK